MPYVCENFEPQTWRTDRCRHCYKTEVDHFIGAAAASISRQVGTTSATVTASSAAYAASIAASRNLASVATTPGSVSAFTASILSNAYKGYASAAASSANNSKPSSSITATSTITPTVPSSVTAETLAALRRQYGISSGTTAKTEAATASPTTTPSTAPGTKLATTTTSPLSSVGASSLNKKNADSGKGGASFGFRRSVSRDITPRRSQSRDDKENDDGRPGPGRLRAMQEIVDDLRKELAIQKQKQELGDREKNTTITKLRAQISDIESQRIALKAKNDVLQSKVDMAAKEAKPTVGPSSSTYASQIKVDELTRKLKDAEEKSKKTEDSQRSSIVRLEARLAEAEVTKSRLKSEKDTQLKEMKDSIQSLETNYQNLLKSEKEAKNLLREKEDRCRTLEKEMQLVISAGGKGRPKSFAEMPETQRQECADQLLRTRNQDLELEVQTLKSDNERLANEAKDLQDEIDEMQDTFREDHAEEFRELQKELEITAKNCRILQYKLRKAERKGELTESDRAAYEEKIQNLTKQLEESGVKSSADSVQAELKMSKEISVRLHEEIDSLKKTKEAKEKENEKLSSELQQSKKWKESMEKELKELRAQVATERSKSYYKTSYSENCNDEKVKMIEEENEKLRWNVAEKERKIDELQSKMSNVDSSGGNNSQIDIRKQLKMVEHEAGMLRQKLLQIEEDNEQLINQNRMLQMKSASRGRGNQIIAPDSSFMENIELKEKVAKLEKELKILKLNAGAESKDVDATEVAMQFARRIASLEAEIHRLKKDQKKEEAIGGWDTMEKDLRNRISSLEQENNDLTLGIRSKETMLNKIEADLSSCRKELERVKMASTDRYDSDETKEKIFSMKQRLDALTQLKDKTQEQYEQATSELTSEKKKRLEMENNLKQAELRAKSLKEQVDSLQAKVSSQQKFHAQRPGTMVVSDEVYKNLEAERDKYRTSSSLMETKLASLQNSLKSVENKLSEKESSLKGLEEKWKAEKSYLEVSLDNEKMTNERENKQHQEKVRTLEEIIRGKDNLISSKEETIRDKETNVRKHEESFKNTIMEKDKKIQDLEGRTFRSEKTVKELQIKLYQLEQSRKDVANRLKDLGKKVEKQDKSYKQLEKELKEERTSQKLEKQLFEEKYHHASQSLEKANKKLKDKEENWKQEKETLNVKTKEISEKLRDIERSKEAMEYNYWANEKKELQQKLDKSERRLQTEREAWEKERNFLNKSLDTASLSGGLGGSYNGDEVEALKKQIAEEKDQMKIRFEKEDKLWQAEITALKMKNQSEVKMMRETQKTLQSNIERLTKEREVLKDILDGAQRNIAEVKSRYLADAEMWERERAALISQTVEMEDIKKQMNTMRREMELMSDNYAKEKRLRTGIENKYSVEKNVWEMSQVQLNNRIKQLEEMASKVPKKSKELQNKLDSAFDKERTEMKKLLESNRDLNNKLIEDLQSTKISKESEITEIRTTFEKERQDWERERYSIQRRNQELEQMANMMLLTQRRLEDLQWEYGAAAEMWAYERDELQELLNDSERHIFRDREKIDELVLELEKFRRIAPVLENFMAGGEEGETLDDRWKKKITQVLKHVEQMSDDLLNYKTAVERGSPEPLKRTSSDPDMAVGDRSQRRGSLPDLVADQGPKSKDASESDADKRSTRWRSPARKPKLHRRQSIESLGGISRSRSPSRWSMASGGSRNESPNRYYSRYNYLHSREGSIYGGSEAGSDDSRPRQAIPNVVFNRKPRRSGGSGVDKSDAISVGSGTGLRYLSGATAATFEEKLRNIGNWSRQVSVEAEDPSSFKETNVDTGETKTSFRYPKSSNRPSSSPSVSHLSYHQRPSYDRGFDYDNSAAQSGFSTPLRPSAPSTSDIHRGFGRQTSESKLAASTAFDDAQVSKVEPASLRVGNMVLAPEKTSSTAKSETTKPGWKTSSTSSSTPSWKAKPVKESTPSASGPSKGKAKPTQPGIGNLLKRFENQDGESSSIKFRSSVTRGDTPVPRTQQDREQAEKQRSGIANRLFSFKK